MRFRDYNTYTRRLATLTSRFRRSRRGGVAVVFGMMMIALASMIGLAVDLGRWVNARDHTVSAIDAAVLAAGRALQTGSNANKAKAIAMAYYQSAIETRIKTIHDHVDFAVIDNGMAVTATGGATIVTPFMGLLGIHELPLLKATGGVQVAKEGGDMPVARIAVGGDGGKNVETVLMLDVSGSMQGSKLQDMKDAAKDLVGIVMWEDQSEFTSRVSVVPFSADVRPPVDLLSKIAGNAQTFSRDYIYEIVTGKGKKKTVEQVVYPYWFAPTECVGERGGSKAYSDDPPTGNNMLTRVHREVWASYIGSTGCYIHQNAEVLPLTNNKSTVEARIDGLVAQGGTAGHVGTAWAYYMLSPQWASVLKDGQKANSYGRKDTRKVAVLMTDGEYNFTYDADQAPSSATLGSGSNGLNSLNKKSSAEQAKSICDNMKKSGIEVFTVGFDLGNNQTAKNTMAYCASSPDSNYDAANGEQLKNAFRDIALRISKLYLSN